MKKLTSSLALTVLTLGLVTPATASLTAGMKEGKPEFKAMNQLAFGPEGVLFIADTKAAAVVAIATGDTKSATSSGMIKAEGINHKIAALVGTSADQIVIEDLAVNPISRQAYLAVSRGKGPDAAALLVRIKADGQPELVSLDKVKFARAELPNPAPDAAPEPGKKGQNRRLEAITDIAYADGKLLVAGLSNEEFASTLRVIPVHSRMSIAAPRSKFIMEPMADSRRALRFARLCLSRLETKITCWPLTPARRSCNSRSVI